MPGSFEEAQREADAGIENPVMEELADMLIEHGAVILEPTKEPVIKVKPEALAKRKKEMAERKLNKALAKSHEKAMVKAGKKPKRKYTRKAKENPPETTSPVVHVIPIWKGDIIKSSWRQICPDGAMMEDSSITTVAQSVGVPESFVKEIIEREIEHDEQLIAQIMEQPKDAFCKESNGHTINIDNVAKHVLNRKEEVVPCNPQSEESETDLLKSEIKTLAFLLAREHEANEVLRAQNGYLKARIAYNANRAIELIKNVRADNRKLHDILHEVAVPEWVKDDRLELRLKNEELEESLRKLSYRGFWARVFNRPVK
jgi:hypothetical protein